MKLEINIGEMCLALGMIFIILKLSGLIHWSWWLVLLPLFWWSPLVVVAILLGMVKLYERLSKGKIK